MASRWLRLQPRKKRRTDVDEFDGEWELMSEEEYGEHNGYGS